LRRHSFPTRRSSDLEEEKEDGEGEAEPRWKEARREKRKRARSAKRSSKGGESEDESDEEAPERAEGKRGKKKGKGAKVRVGACLSAPLLASLSLCLSVCVCARARPPAPALACVCISLRTRTHNVSMTGGCAPRAPLQRRRPSCAPPQEVRTSEPLFSLARSQLHARHAELRWVNAGYILGTRLACSFALSLFLHFTPLLSLSLSLFPSLRLVTRALPLSCRVPPKI
jgi:hypothetical protein